MQFHTSFSIYDILCTLTKFAFHNSDMSLQCHVLIVLTFILNCSYPDSNKVSLLSSFLNEMNPKCIIFIITLISLGS